MFATIAKIKRLQQQQRAHYTSKYVEKQKPNDQQQTAAQKWANTKTKSKERKNVYKNNLLYFFA